MLEAHFWTSKRTDRKSSEENAIPARNGNCRGEIMIASEGKIACLVRTREAMAPDGITILMSEESSHHQIRRKNPS